MSNLARTLVNIDILSQDMQDELDNNSVECDTDNYLFLLSQYQSKLSELDTKAQVLTEVQFLNLLMGSQLGHITTSKQMLKVQISLIHYVLDYYRASRKADAILDSDFAEQADKRLNILQSKAIKMRKQFKTVATALGEQDYLRFVMATPLPQQAWSWAKINQI